MTTPPLAVAPDPLAAAPPPLRWALERCAPEAPALALLGDQPTPDALITTWMANEQAIAATRLIAVVLPPREGAWWGWVSARHVASMAGAPPPSAAVHKALAAVEQWIVRPDDAARRAAWEAGGEAGLDTPIGMVCAAVFLAGGSVAPVGVAHVPPPPGVSSTLIAAAVSMAAHAGDPAHIAPILKAFVSQGLEIVKRLGGWDAALQAARDAHERQRQEQAGAAAPAAS